MNAHETMERIALQLTLIASHWDEYKEAVGLDQDRRIARAMGIDLDVYFAYVDSTHPPGVTKFSSRISGRKRRKELKKKKPHVEPWAPKRHSHRRTSRSLSRGENHQ